LWGKKMDRRRGGGRRDVGSRKAEQLENQKGKNKILKLKVSRNEHIGKKEKE